MIMSYFLFVFEEVTYMTHAFSAEAFKLKESGFWSCQQELLYIKTTNSRVQITFQGKVGVEKQA